MHNYTNGLKTSLYITDIDAQTFVMVVVHGTCIFLTDTQNLHITIIKLLSSKLSSSRKDTNADSEAVGSFVVN